MLYYTTGQNNRQKIGVVYGCRYVEPLQFRIERRYKWDWWRRVAEYYVVTDMVEVGPFHSYEDASELMLLGKRVGK